MITIYKTGQSSIFLKETIEYSAASAADSSTKPIQYIHASDGIPTSQLLLATKLVWAPRNFRNGSENDGPWKMYLLSSMAI